MWGALLQQHHFSPQKSCIPDSISLLSGTQKPFQAPLLNARHGEIFWQILTLSSQWGKTSHEGSAEYTLCCCGTYLLPWGHRDPPDTVGVGGVAIWKARGWEITCWVLQGLSTSCRRGEKNLSKRSDSERHQGLPNCLLMAAVCRLVAGTPTVLIHGTGQRPWTTWGLAKGVMWNLSEFLG